MTKGSASGRDLNKMEKERVQLTENYAISRCLVLIKDNTADAIRGAESLPLGAVTLTAVARAAGIVSVAIGRRASMERVFSQNYAIGLE
jgi:hypothetical protein